IEFRQGIVKPVNRKVLRQQKQLKIFENRCSKKSRIVDLVSRQIVINLHYMKLLLALLCTLCTGISLLSCNKKVDSPAVASPTDVIPAPVNKPVTRITVTVNNSPILVT